MHSHILIPVALDHEAVVTRKLEVARRLLAEGGRITLLTVLEDVPGFVSEFVDLKPENHLTAKVTERLKAIAGGDPAIAVKIAKGKAGVQIVQVAEAGEVDLIIVGSHRPGISDYFLGSTAARVARRAHCAVHILR